MKNEVFWKNPGYQNAPVLKEKIECDFLIVGGGITGVSVAYFLNKHGAKNIVLVDKYQIANGATGRAAGILTPNTELDLKDLIEKFGRKKGLTYWYGLLGALHTIKSIVKKEKIDCDFENDPTLYAEYHYKTFNSVIDEYKLNKEMHFRVKLLLQKELEKEIHSLLFKDALLAHHGASINPLKYSQNLALKLKEAGVKIYENTSILKVKNNKAITEEGEIKFKKIIYATDSNKKIKEARPIKSTIAVSYPLTKKQLLEIGLMHRDMLWDSKKSYDYFKLTKDNRLLVGFGDRRVNTINQKDFYAPHLTHIKKFLERMFPKNKIKIEYAWSGEFCVTKDLIPLIKFRKNEVFILATGGQTISTMAAKYAVNRIFNRKSSLDLFYK